MFRIAHSVLADHWARAGNADRSAVTAQSLAVPASQVVAFGFNEALGLLKPSERDVFLLRELAGLSYQEIAAASDLTESAVRSKLRRARCEIRQMLGGRLNDMLGMQ